MKSSNKEVTINHNAKRLFDIVLDLEKYPEFIPWCTDMKIHSKKSNEIFADMYVLYKLLLPQKFGSHVIFNVEKLEIKTIYINAVLLIKPHITSLYAVYVILFYRKKLCLILYVFLNIYRTLQKSRHFESNKKTIPEWGEDSWD